MKKYSFEYEEEEEGYTVDGITYPDMPEVILRSFSFCGCGDPEKALEFIYESLKAYKQRWDNEIDYKTANSRFPSEEVRYFFLYWADKEGLMEHGGSVDGAWLTKTGENLINDFEIFKK